MICRSEAGIPVLRQVASYLCVRKSRETMRIESTSHRFVRSLHFGLSSARCCRAYLVSAGKSAVIFRRKFCIGPIIYEFHRASPELINPHIFRVLMLRVSKLPGRVYSDFNLLNYLLLNIWALFLWKVILPRGF